MFPDTFVGATSTIDVVITNISNVVQTPNFSGGAPLDPANFSGTQNCAGRTFQPGDSCVFSYDFHPQSAGSHSTTTTIGVDSENFPITFSGNSPSDSTTTTSTTMPASTTTTLDPDLGDDDDLPLTGADLQVWVLLAMGLLSWGAVLVMTPRQED